MPEAGGEVYGCVGGVPAGGGGAVVREAGQGVWRDQPWARLGAAWDTTSWQWVLPFVGLASRLEPSVAATRP